MRTGFPCNDSRFFPVEIDLQGVPCKPYRVWVYSVDASLKMNSLLYIVIINLNINLKKIMCRKFKGLLKLMFEYLTHKVKF